MRRFNLKLFLILGSAFLLLAVGVFVVHRLQSDRIAQALLWQARRSQNEGRLEQAARYLGRYLEFAPDDVQERANLGCLLADDKLAANYKLREQAFLVLGQVLARQPERDDIRRLLVRVAMDLEQFDYALEHLDHLLKSSPENGELELLCGQCQEAQDKYTEAADWYRKAVRHAPHQLDGYVRLAKLLKRRSGPTQQPEQAKEADRVMQDLVANNDQSFQAHLARWHYRQEAGSLGQADKLEEAGRDVVRALELAPEEADVLLAAGELGQARGKFDQARQHLQRGLELYPQKLPMYQALAGLEVRSGRRPQAVACLRQGLTVLSGQDRSELLWSLTNLLIDGGDVAEAGTIMVQFRQSNPAPEAVDYLRARLLLHDGHWSEAAKILEGARPLLDGTPELMTQVDLFLGQCYEQLDEPALQLEAFGRAVSRDPSSLPAHLGMAGAQLTLGRLDDAVHQYERLMQLPNAPAGGWTEIARLLIQRNRQRDQRDWHAVEEALRRAEETPSQAVEVTLLRVEALVAQNQLEPAHALLVKMRDSQPNQLPFQAALASLAWRQGKAEEARQLLEEAERRDGDTGDMRLAWAQFWSSRHGSEAAAALKKLTQGLDKFTGTERTRLLEALAEVFYRADRVKEAGELWSRLAEQPGYENNLRIRLLLLDLAGQTENESGIQTVLKDLERIEGDKGSLWSYGQAMLLICQAKKGDKTHLDEAQTILDTVAAQRPEWAAVPSAKGEVNDLKGNAEQAIVNYRQALALGDRSTRASRRLIQLLCRQQRYAEADSELRKLQQQAPLSSGLERLAVDVSLHNQDPARAVLLARQALAVDSTDYRDYLWFGQVLAASGGQPQEAERQLRRAVALAPEVPDAWLALVQYLAGSGHKDEAAKVLEEARPKLPTKQAALALAQGCEAIDRLEEAQKHYQAALAEQPEDAAVLRSIAGFYRRAGRPRDAEVSLRKLVDLGDRVSATDQTWARRTLAMALAEQGDYRRFPDALDLVGLKLGSGGQVMEYQPLASDDPVEDLRARARVLAASKRRCLLSPAISYLEEVGKRQALSAEDQWLLAQLYEAGDAWPKAREQLLHLVTAHDKDPLYLGHYAASLLRHGEAAEAQPYIDKLEGLEQALQVEPGTFGTLDLKAQMLAARGEDDKALALLKAHVGRKNARPEEVLSLASLLAARNHLQDALDLCEQVWQTAPPEVVSGPVVALLLRARPTPPQYAQVERQLKAALQTHPQAAILRVQLAYLQDLQGHPQEAEALYRKILGQDNLQVAALNNLAWLLTHRPDKAPEALALINRALEAAGPRPDLLDTRGFVYLALGQADPAVTDLQEVALDAPTACRYLHLARAYLLANNQEAARETLRRARAAGLESNRLQPDDLLAYNQLTGKLEQR